MVEPPFRLLAITPPEGATNPSIVDAWASASAHGVAVLLRHPGAPLRELASMIREGRLRGVAERCTSERIPLLLSLGPAELGHLARIGGSAGLRQRTGAPICGVQLRGDPTSAQLQELRRSLGPGWLGRSCHGAPTGSHGPVDYTCVAPIFPPTTVQAGRLKTAAGLGVLRAWSSGPQARIFALGGVGPTTAESCLAAGAWGLAGIGLFFGDPARVGEDVASVVQIVDRHLRDVRPLPQ